MSTSHDSCCLPSVKKQKHDFQVLDTSAGTGNLCILGHLGSVFIWSCFVSCLLFLLFYVSLHNLCSGTCRKIPSFCVRSMYNKTIILDSVFVISRIINVLVSVISLSLRLPLITLTLTLIILDIAKTSSNNCLI